MNNFKRTQQYALCIIARNRNRKLEVWGKRKRINNIHWQQPAIHLLHFFNSIIIQSLLGSALFRHSTASLCDISSFVENFSLPEEQHPCVVFHRQGVKLVFAQSIAFSRHGGDGFSDVGWSFFSLPTLPDFWWDERLWWWQADVFARGEVTQGNNK